MIVFGWGSEAKVLGSVGCAQCPNCANEATWQVLESSRRASLYFVPVAKWNRRYFVACPICHYGAELKDREHAESVLAEGRRRSLDRRQVTN
jgi:hypothetical protein